MNWIRAIERLPGSDYLPVKIEGYYTTARFEGCDDGTGGIIWSCFDQAGNRIDTTENRFFIFWLDESPSLSEGEEAIGGLVEALKGIEKLSSDKGITNVAKQALLNYKQSKK